jgi:transcriptional regulator with XRE-family HTH domain
VWVQQREYKKVGKILGDAREAAGLTQQVLANKLAKPQSFVSNYESGQRRVDILEFLRIVDAMEADPQKLFSEVVKLNFAPKARTPKR